MKARRNIHISKTVRRKNKNNNTQAEQTEKVQVSLKRLTPTVKMNGL